VPKQPKRFDTFAKYRKREGVDRRLDSDFSEFRFLSGMAILNGVRMGVGQVPFAGVGFRALQSVYRVLYIPTTKGHVLTSSILFIEITSSLDARE